MLDFLGVSAWADRSNGVERGSRGRETNADVVIDRHNRIQIRIPNPDWNAVDFWALKKMFLHPQDHIYCDFPLAELGFMVRVGLFSFFGGRSARVPPDKKKYGRTKSETQWNSAKRVRKWNSKRMQNHWFSLDIVKNETLPLFPCGILILIFAIKVSMTYQ